MSWPTRGRIATTGTVAEIVAAEPARITYRTDGGALADPAALVGLPALAAGPRADRGGVELESTDLQTTLTALLHAARTTGAVLPHLDASHASLERAFLAVAARGEDPHDGGRDDVVAPVAA